MNVDRPFPNFELPDPMVMEILGKKTPEERIALGFAANRAVRERLRAHFAFEHPDWTDEQLNAAVAERMLWNNPT
jgi:hypothetical protein